MADANIVPTDNGPYWISGDFTVTDANGNEFAAEGDAYLCRCGESSEKPFCDGSHNTAGFNDASRAT